jgi:hypothetical protein
MDCLTAEPFVSILYDGEEVPKEAVLHITSCATCRARLREYAAISGEMRVLAASVAQSLPPLPSLAGSLSSRRRWRIALGRYVRVPRMALVGCAALLVLISAGWLRTIAQPRTVTKFDLTMRSTVTYPDGSRSGTTNSPVLEKGKPDLSWSESGGKGLGSLIEALSIRNDAVVLSIRLKHFDRHLDLDQLRQEMKKVKPQLITYVPGQQVSVPVEGGGSILMSGSVVQQEEGRIISAKQELLLPALDEISLNMPILIRDKSEIAAKELYAGADIRDMNCGSGQPGACGICLYSPGAGQFCFSIHPFAGSIMGVAGMGAILFNEGGHSYMLYSASPITGGDQPRPVWILHRKDYRPSQHGGSKSDDSLDGLSSGDLSGMLK